MRLQQSTVALVVHRFNLVRLLLLALSAASALSASDRVFAHGEEDARRAPNLAFVETAFGQTGDPKKIARTIRVEAVDTMRYVPSRIVVRQGETVRLVFKNSGKLNHEAVLGTMDDLKAHAEMMRRHPGMKHDEPFMVHVAPGSSREIIWQFTQAGEFNFGCLEPGHFEAGMIGSIVVERPVR